MRFLIYLLIFISTTFLIFSLTKVGQDNLSQIKKSLEKQFIILQTNSFYLAIILISIFIFFIGYLCLKNFILATLFSATALIFPNIFSSYLQKKRQEKILAQLPLALITLSNSLKSGLSFPQAIKNLSEHSLPPLSQELTYLFYKNKIGHSLPLTLNEISERLKLPQLKFLSCLISLSSENGAPVADPLVNLSCSIQEETKFKQKLSILSLQVKIQALISILLPWIVGGCFYLLEPQLIFQTISNPWGQKLFLLAAVLEILGILWLKQMIQLKR